MNYLEYQEYQDYLCHHGVKGQKWGVRRYQNKDGSLTPAGKKRYVDDDGELTSAGKKQIKKLNKLDEKDNKDRRNLDLAARNIENFGSGTDAASKFIAKVNNKHISNYTKIIEKNDKQIKQILSDLKDQKVDMVVRYDPWKDRMYYKQSDAQQIRADARKTISEELKRNDELMKKYVNSSKVVDNPARNPYYKSLDKSSEKLTRKTEEYLDTLDRSDAKKLIERDPEHGNYYVNRKVFDPSVTYDDYISISDEFAKRYKN